MNAAYLTEALQETVKPKFKGKGSLKARAAMHYPDTLARDYLRIANTYMTLLNKAMAKHMPAVRRAIDAERANMRQDSIYDVIGASRRAFARIKADFEAAVRQFGLRDKLEALENRAVKLSIREWKRVVHQTLGIDLLGDYYSGSFYSGTLADWVKANTGLISTIPKDALARMERIVEEGYLSGKSNTAIGRDIQEAYSVERRHAQLIARDQVSKLNASLTQKQHEDAGVESYVWSSSKDARVRECHADHSGKEFRWSEPPEDYYATKSRGRVYTGYRYHPGEAIACRCVALPVFRIEGLSLPWESAEDKGGES